MPRERIPQPYATAQALARTAGWLTSVAAIVVLAYVGKNWSSKGQSFVAGLLASIIALLNDSWEVAGLTDRSGGFPRLTAARAVLHDLFALAIGIGGIIMIWISEVGMAIRQVNGFGRDIEKERYLMAGMWCLTAVVAWRFLFAIWGCINCSRESSWSQRRQREMRFFHQPRYDGARS